MKRTVFEQLLKWSRKPDNLRKPLILQGARQVGKSWILDELGKTEFEDYIHINFQQQRELRDIFQKDLDITRIISTLEITASRKIIPGKTLLILDEIQEADKGVTALKYFKEDAPQYHVAAAGSLLGVSMHRDTSFPVGKVEFVDIYPMSFIEFLWAIGQEDLAQLAQSGDWEIGETFKSRFEEFLKIYYFVGGMPEAVQMYVSTKDFDEVRSVQLDLLRTYDNDFSKYPPTNEISRIRMVWQSIPSQLAKENRKFVYGALKTGGRAAEFEKAIQWLTDAGLAIKATRVTAGEVPLRGFEDKDSFKLYLLDTGLLGALAGIDSSSLLNGSSYFAQYKGALTEQYICSQLQLIISSEQGASAYGETHIHYWKPDTGTSEVDFIVEMNCPDGKIPVPIEVKAQENLKAKSLTTYIKKYNPMIAIKTSLSNKNIDKEKHLAHLPLYMIHALRATIGEMSS